jgi:hypothetical protein
MARNRRARRGVLLVIVLAIGATAYAGFIHTPPGPRSLREFDPDRMAQLELDMWQAYYLKERLRLFRGLVTMLHEQYRYTWAKATQAAFFLARGASRFGDSTENYDRVRPDLERAYAIARDWTGSRFNAAAVARAELAWWTARRVPGQDGAEHVGALIGEEYALLYDVPPERVAQAAVLRARAARLRDDGGDQADWPAVEDLLRQSYRTLGAAVRGVERSGTPTP